MIVIWTMHLVIWGSDCRWEHVLMISPRLPEREKNYLHESFISTVWWGDVERLL